MLTVSKFCSLNILETSGPVQDCNGIALPFTTDSTIISNMNTITTTTTNDTTTIIQYLSYFLAQLDFVRLWFLLVPKDFAS